MDLKDNETKRPISLLKSFYFAIVGIMTAVKQERNLRIHLTLAFCAIILSFAFSISATEWLIVLLAIGGMIALEMINTALERLVDLVTMEYHPLAKQVKDIAAGAVLVYAITSVIIGVVIFGPHLFHFLKFG